MTANENGEGAPTRRVRPWIAALLTFLGWGVGLYYARRTRAAVWLALANVALGIGLAIGVTVYVFQTHSAPLTFIDPSGWSPFNSLQMALTAIIAVWVWWIVAQRQKVETAGSTRLWGYVGIFLLPLVLAMLLAMPIRFMVMQPFRMPSGSMQPTIQVGDYFAVTKSSYGYGRFSFAPLEGLLPSGRWFAHEPHRGDIVVFRPSPEPDRDFVKRLVGLPGDRIQMIDGILHINGRAVARQAIGPVEVADETGSIQRIPAYRETLPNGVSYTTLDRGVSELDDTPEYVVPNGRYFMLGDDRDNSADSRIPSVVGFVPYDNLVGRVDFIFRSGTH